MWFSSLVQGIKSTLKSEDTEGFFEIYVTRSCGYLWALFFKQLHIHPNVVTIVSIILGALSGYMFYYDDLFHTLWGIFLLIWANWYDCADGQLARMTGKKSLLGRILDGFAGDVWFISLSVYGLRHLGVYGFGCCQPLPDLFVIVNSVLWPTIIVMSICFFKKELINVSWILQKYNIVK